MKLALPLILCVTAITSCATEPNPRGQDISESPTASPAPAETFPVEPRDGFQIYDSDGDPKAQGLRITMEFPDSWTSEPGTRPHVLTNLKFPGDNSQGYAQVLVMDLGLGYTPSQEEMDATFDPSSARDLIPEGAVLVSSEKVKVDGLPGLKTTYTMNSDRMGVSVQVACDAYHTYWDGKMPQFMFCLGSAGEADAETFANQLVRVKPLLAQMANSVVIHNRYAR